MGSSAAGSGEGSRGGSDDPVDRSTGSGSNGPSRILGGFGDGVIGDSAGGGGMDSCFGRGDIGCWNAQFCWYGALGWDVGGGYGGEYGTCGECWGGYFW